MGGQNNWAIDIDANDWMRGLEKRVLHEERRPSIRSAADLLGPGFAPYAVETANWNSDASVRNGFWWSRAGALNPPDSAKSWMGMAVSNSDGTGYQTVEEQGGASPPAIMTRTFRMSGGIRVYTTWVPLGTTSGGSTPDPATLGYVFNQSTAAAVWNISHPLGFRPNVTAVDSGGAQVEGDLVYLTPGSIRITFSAAFAGTAYLS